MSGRTKPPPLAPEQLVGTWTLRSWEIRYADGRVSRPFGPAPLGMLLYTPDGGMSACIAARGRKRLSTANPREASPAERAAAFDSCFAYSGRYRVRGATVRHELTVALNPAMVGTLQLRDARLGRGRLELSAAEKTGGGRRHVLTWARAAAAPARGAPGARKTRRKERT